MIHLVTGGSGSGKSAYAEDWICSYCAGGGALFYIATMIPWGEETKRKIQRHREMRRAKGFTTIERYTDIKGLSETWESQTPGDCVLLECMSNLVANEMYQPEGAGEHTAEAVVEGIRFLEKRCSCLVIVSNEVFGECAEDSEEMRAYKRTLAQVNIGLAALAERVTEVVCGLPVSIEGSGAADAAKGGAGMKLIIGGAMQGKRAYAERAYGVLCWADGGTCPLDAVFDCEGMYHFEALIRRWMEAGQDTETLAGEIYRRNPQIVIVSTEIGCGLVPVDGFLRVYREQVGRVCTELASYASRVDRVVCGIASHLKEE